MSEGKFFKNLILSLIIGFLMLAIGVVGSVVGNELINSEYSVAIPFGLGLYLIIGILEILLVWGLFRTWRSLQ